MVVAWLSASLRLPAGLPPDIAWRWCATAAEVSVLPGVDLVIVDGAGDMEAMERLDYPVWWLGDGSQEVWPLCAQWRRFLQPLDDPSLVLMLAALQGDLDQGEPTVGQEEALRKGPAYQAWVCPQEGARSGDGYAVLPLADGSVVFVLFDATGHGVAASWEAELFRRLLDKAARQGSFAGLLRQLADDACRCLPLGHFVAATMLCWDARAGLLHGHNAGMPDMLMQLDGARSDCRSSHLAWGLSPETGGGFSSWTVRVPHALMGSDGVERMVGLDCADAVRDDAFARLCRGESLLAVVEQLFGAYDEHYDDVSLLFCSP